MSSETRNKSSEALVSHRIGSTNTPIVDTKTCATQAENLSKSCAETQADGLFKNVLLLYIIYITACIL